MKPCRSQSTKLSYKRMYSTQSTDVLYIFLDALGVKVYTLSTTQMFFMILTHKFVQT